jgi:uncharacterized protein (TIGR00730 family)
MSQAPVDAPYEQKSQDKEKSGLTPTVLAYENPAFMRSDSGRLVRIICEFMEPGERLRQHNIKGTILFFGSARSMSKKQYDETIGGLRAELAAVKQQGGDGGKLAELATKIERFEKVEWMCPYVDITEDLAYKLTKWSIQQPHLREFFSKQPDYMTGFVESEVPSRQPLVVCTGGGPGIMEAANKGAHRAGGLSMGCGITLPFEKGLNPYVTQAQPAAHAFDKPKGSLAFEFHYFFTRKFWMMLPAKILVVGPGGFGTLDELMELLTLKQTGKLGELVVVLLGVKFWKTIVNWQALADFGVISQAEVDKLFFTDSADEAFTYITGKMEESGVRLVQTTSPQVSPSRPSGMSGAIAGSFALGNSAMGDKKQFPSG